MELIEAWLEFGAIVSPLNPYGVIFGPLVIGLFTGWWSARKASRPHISGELRLGTRFLGPIKQRNRLLWGLWHAIVLEVFVVGGALAGGVLFGGYQDGALGAILGGFIAAAILGVGRWARESLFRRLYPAP
jgi:hypothetical protein